MLGLAHDVDEADARPRCRACSASARGSTPPRCARAPCDPRARIVSTMPSAVSGLTKQRRPRPVSCPAAAPGIATALMHAVLRVHRAAEDRDGLAEQRLRGRRRARLDDHAGAFVADGQRLLETRRPSHFMTAGVIVAVTTGLSAVPEALAVLMSAPPNRSPRSEGLMGDASTRTTTSSGFGSAWGRSRARARGCLPSSRSNAAEVPWRVLASAICRLRFRIHREVD